MNNFLLKARQAYVDVWHGVTPVLGERNFDEVALYAPDAWRAAALIAELAYQPGDAGDIYTATNPWQRPRYFNRSEDRVRYALPNGDAGEYGVHYDFLQPYGEPYRLEVMHLLAGSSPAHHRYLRAWSYGLGDNDQNGQVVHVSYKPPRGFVANAAGRAEDYDAELERLEALGFVLVQANHSTYGAFSYYEHTDPAVLPAGVYLKPRVNLRDEQ
jgi:hypothetical protein